MTMSPPGGYQELRDFSSCRAQAERAMVAALRMTRYAFR